MALGDCDQEDVHFICIVKNGPQEVLQVSSYDIRKESFFISNFPQDNFFANPHELDHFWWNNSLAIGDISEEELRFLVLEKQVLDDEEGNDIKYKWSEKRVVVPLPFLKGRTHLKKGLVPVEASSDEVWFHSQGKFKFCYDMKAWIIKGQQPLDGAKRFTYQPSLKNLDGMNEVDDDLYHRLPYSPPDCRTQ